MSTSNHPRGDKAIDHRSIAPRAPRSADKPVGVCIVDSEMRLWALDEAAAAVFGMSEPLPGDDFVELIRFLWPEPLASNAVAHIRTVIGSSGLEAVESGVHGVGQRPQPAPEGIHGVTLPDGSRGAVCYVYDLSRLQGSSGSSSI